MSRQLAIIAVVVLLLFGGVLAGVPRLLDGRRQGQVVAAELAEATGLRVRIEGTVDVSLLPRPHIAVNNLKLVEADGQTVVLSAPRLDLGVSLASLMGGTYAVENIGFVNPHLRLRRLANGQWNWQPKLAQAQSLSVRRISLSGGQVTLEGQTTEVFSGIAGKVSLPDGLTVFHANAEGNWRNAPLRLLLDIAAPIGRDPSLANLQLDIGAAEASLRLGGTIDTRNPSWPLQGQLEASAGQAAALMALSASLGLSPAPSSDTGLQQPFTLAASLEGKTGDYALRSFTAKLGDLDLQGVAKIQTLPHIGLSVALQAGKLDLARWPSLEAWAKSGQLVLPPSWLGAFDLTFAAIKREDILAHDTHIKGDLADGIIRITRADTVLPGDSRISLSGTITTAENAPALADGTVSLDTQNLRDLLAGLNIPLPQGLDATALKQVKVSLGVRGPWRGWGLPDVDVTMDGIHLTGQIAPKDEQGLFDAHLAVDSLDLGRYGQLAGVPGWIWKLPPSRLDVAFKQLRIGDQTAQNVSLRAMVLPSLLTITGLDTADFGGNRLRLAGTWSPAATAQSDITLQLTTTDFARMRSTFAPLNLLLPVSLAPFVTGPVDLSVRWKNSEEERQRLSSLSAGEAKLDLVVTRREGQPESWKARLRHRETALLLRQIAPNLLSRPEAVLGPLDIYAEGLAGTDNHWQLSGIQGQAAGLTLRTGELDVLPGQKLQASGSLTLASGSLDLWRQTLVPLSLGQYLSGSLSLALEKLTVLDSPLTEGQATFALAPDGRFTLSNFSGKWREGTIALKGDVSPGAVPELKGTLDARSLNVSLRGGERFAADGLLDLGLRFETSGTDSATLLKNMEGDGEFTLDSGTFSGLDFAALTEELKDRKQTANLPTLLMRGGQGDLSSFGGDFTLAEGIAKSEQLRLRMPVASAEIRATLDLSAPRLDAVAEVSLRDLPEAPAFGMTVSGALSSLAASFNTEGLANWLAGVNKPPVPVAAPAGEEQKTEEKPAEGQPDSPESPTPPALTEDKPEEETKTATEESAPVRRPAARPATNPVTDNARPAPVANSSGENAPPSIQDILAVMPSIAGPAQAAVAAARAEAAQSTEPQITLTPQDGQVPAPMAAAPEFQGTTLRPVRETSSNALMPSVTINVPEGDRSGASANTPPPASPDALIGNLGGE